MTKMSRRFVVRTVRGHARSGLNYIVLDTAFCYRLMAEYGSNSGRLPERRRLDAEAYAAKLERDCAMAERGRCQPS